MGQALRDDGHNVTAIDEDAALKALPDDELLELAIAEERVLVTANVKDFVPLLSERLAGGRSHSGCVLIPRGIRTKDFGTIVSELRRVLSTTDQEQWQDRTVWLRAR